MKTDDIKENLEEGLELIEKIEINESLLALLNSEECNIKISFHKGKNDFLELYYNTCSYDKTEIINFFVDKVSDVLERHKEHLGDILKSAQLSYKEDH